MNLCVTFPGAVKAMHLGLMIQIDGAGWNDGRGAVTSYIRVSGNRL
jgi:hypothetical protein